MQIEKNKSLKEFNTFGIDCAAKYFISISSQDELLDALRSEIHSKLFILGGGSNMLLTKDIDALVLHINLKGIEVVNETNHHVFLKVNAGENWHEFVQYCINNDFGGIENLSLIPGNVGTAPIQNIGAYGVELKDVFESCSALHLETLKNKEFSNSDCKFGYRNSIFKNEVKGKYIITDVTFKLTKNEHAKRISYGAIKNELAAHNIEDPNISDISKAVIAIRESKLPDPKKLGNSGSFFKNPIISLSEFNSFTEQFPEAPFYKISETSYKIPAGWLIEQSGFKGTQFGDAGVHKNQALVLVNYGNATGEEIWNLALKIQSKVKKDFNITIEPEVNVI
ncbi:MAG: UDP-N-acetylmuramate dehydrogenase [Flavobacteriaceae bacterium]|nr:UDP-N-acetylmuramate dehydrogenase [Flavobacteriaceae bacterium]